MQAAAAGEQPLTRVDFLRRAFVELAEKLGRDLITRAELGMHKPAADVELNKGSRRPLTRLNELGHVIYHDKGHAVYHVTEKAKRYLRANEK